MIPGIPFTQRVRNWLLPDRLPDVVIGGADDPYLIRWHLIPRNPIFNVYLHQFCRSDDDRALHDHPWVNLSWLLVGTYDEVVPGKHDTDRIDPDQAKRDPRFHTQIRRYAGALVLRRASAAHRVVLLKDAQGKERPVWTLFITGPRFREWGFWCPKGWRHWQEYTRELPGGVSEIGRGCE